MALIAEAFVFTYLGLTLLSTSIESISFSFIVLQLIFFVTIRTITFFGLAFLMKYNYINKIHNLNIKYRLCGLSQLKTRANAVLCFSGTIKGAVAFGLTVSLNKDIIKNR